jgi:hypothetical protein
MNVSPSERYALGGSGGGGGGYNSFSSTCKGVLPSSGTNS